MGVGVGTGRRDRGGHSLMLLRGPAMLAVRRSGPADTLRWSEDRGGVVGVGRRDCGADSRMLQKGPTMLQFRPDTL